MSRRIVVTNDGGLEIKETQQKLPLSRPPVEQFPILESTRQRKSREWKEEAALHAVEKSEKDNKVMGVVEDPIDLAHLIYAVGLKLPKPKRPKSEVS